MGVTTGWSGGTIAGKGAVPKPRVEVNRPPKAMKIGQCVHIVLSHVVGVFGFGCTKGSSKGDGFTKGSTGTALQKVPPSVPSAAQREEGPQRGLLWRGRQCTPNFYWNPWRQLSQPNPIQIFYWKPWKRLSQPNPIQIFYWKPWRQLSKQVSRAPRYARCP